LGALVDIHAHILPGIDDGPDDLEQSLAMARAAVESGIELIASTPHLRPDFPDVHVDELGARCEELRGALEAAEIPLIVTSGAEVSLTWALTANEEDLRLASYGQRGTSLLVETPTVSAVGVAHLLYELRARGYSVTLGHPERSEIFQQDDRLVHELVDQGLLLQINADSLLGSDSRGTKRLATELVTSGLAHAIASDAHRGERWRPITRLPKAVEVAGGLVGAERADWMTREVPRAIVEGAQLPEAPPLASTGRQRLRQLRNRRRWLQG
jgi:protein-tyrosine phosphatase